MSRRPLIGPVRATAALAVPLVALDRRMMATGGPGIIPFELAGPDRSAAILEKWGAEGRRAARASLLLDFPYLVSYTALNVALMQRSSDRLRANGAPVFAALGPVVAVVQVAAGACDAIENAALLGVVARRGDARLASVARTAALTKFAGLAAGWLYGAAALRRRGTDKREESSR
jgi:hypothetical protein